LFYFATLSDSSSIYYYISELNSFQGAEEIGLTYLGYNIQIDENSEFKINIKEVNIFEANKIQSSKSVAFSELGNLIVYIETIDGINFYEDQIILDILNTNNYSINNSFTEISSKYKIDQEPEVKFFKDTERFSIQLDFEKGIPKFTNILNSEETFAFSFYLETKIKNKSENKNM